MFATTHTGSLPRPKDLTELLQAREDGQTPPNLDQRIAEAVREVVDRQVQAGVTMVNDGEMSKIGYSTYVTNRLTGFSRAAQSPPQRPLFDVAEFPDLQDYRRPVSPSIRYAYAAECTGDIKPRDTAAVQTDIANLKAAAQSAGAQQVFMSAASPGVVAVFIPDKHYGSHERYVGAIAEAMRPEYRAIVDAGLTLQVDCPDLAMVGNRYGSLEEFRRIMNINMDALNHALSGLPADRVRIHICWGNYEGPHNHDVELKDIIDIILRANAAGLSLEACNPRHAHEWQVFEDTPLPDDKYVIPGVIDSTNNFVEHPDLIAQRLLNYANVVGADRVMGGSDCGFGTFAGVSNVAPSVVWAKFQSMAEGARRATARAKTPVAAR
ncbi:MAG: cobalamin-independent methionine synthase II family protein [Chloroflexi bacterium]|nr:cobalamin-independent methionine synthase II family protein [Chloroflexota bacterium]MBV9894165.1 cobalamin-independent methionine synthase II family protein [Chloroflexota bacterium]